MANRFQTPVDSTFINTYTPIPFEDIVALSAYKQNLYDQGLSNLNSSFDALDAYKAITGSKDEEYLYNLRQKRNELADQYALQDLSDLQVQASLNRDMRNLIDKTALDRITGSYGQWVEENKSLSELMKKGQYNPALFDPSRAAGWDSSTMGQYQNLAEAELDFSQTALPYFSQLDNEFWGLFSQGDYDFMQHGVGLKRIQDIAASAAPNVLATEAGQQLLKKYAYETGISLNDLTAEEAVTVVYDALVDYGKQFAKNQVNQLSKPKGSDSDPDAPAKTPNVPIPGSPRKGTVVENQTGGKDISDMRSDKRANKTFNENYQQTKNQVSSILNRFDADDIKDLTEEDMLNMSDGDKQTVKRMQDMQWVLDNATNATKEAFYNTANGGLNVKALNNSLAYVFNNIPDDAPEAVKALKAEYAGKITNKSFTLEDLNTLLNDKKNAFKQAIAKVPPLSSVTDEASKQFYTMFTPSGDTGSAGNKYIDIQQFKYFYGAYEKQLGENIRVYNTVENVPTYNTRQPLITATRSYDGDPTNLNGQQSAMYTVLESVGSNPQFTYGVIYNSAQDPSGNEVKDRESRDGKSFAAQFRNRWNAATASNKLPDANIFYNQSIVAPGEDVENWGVNFMLSFNEHENDNAQSGAIANNFDMTVPEGEMLKGVIESLKNDTNEANVLLGYKAEALPQLKEDGRRWNTDIGLDGKHVVFSNGDTRQVVEGNSDNYYRYTTYEEVYDPESESWRKVPNTEDYATDITILDKALTKHASTRMREDEMIKALMLQ